MPNHGVQDLGGASTDWKFPNCSFARLRMARILLQPPDETFTIGQLNTNQMILFFSSILPFPGYTWMILKSRHNQEYQWYFSL